MRFFDVLFKTTPTTNVSKKKTKKIKKKETKKNSKDKKKKKKSQARKKSYRKKKTKSLRTRHNRTGGSRLPDLSPLTYPNTKVGVDGIPFTIGPNVTTITGNASSS